MCLQLWILIVCICTNVCDSLCQRRSKAPCLCTTSINHEKEALETLLREDAPRAKLKFQNPNDPCTSYNSRCLFNSDYRMNRKILKDPGGRIRKVYGGECKPDKNVWAAADYPIRENVCQEFWFEDSEGKKIYCEEPNRQDVINKGYYTCRSSGKLCKDGWDSKNSIYEQQFHPGVNPSRREQDKARKDYHALPGVQALDKLLLLKKAEEKAELGEIKPTVQGVTKEVGDLHQLLRSNVVYRTIARKSKIALQNQVDRSKQIAKRICSCRFSDEVRLVRSHYWSREQMETEASNPQETLPLEDLRVKFAKYVTVLNELSLSEKGKLFAMRIGFGRLMAFAVNTGMSHSSQKEYISEIRVMMREKFSQYADQGEFFGDDFDQMSNVVNESDSLDVILPDWRLIERYVVFGKHCNYRYQLIFNKMSIDDVFKKAEEEAAG